MVALGAVERGDGLQAPRQVDITAKGAIERQRIAKTLARLIVALLREREPPKVRLRQRLAPERAILAGNPERLLIERDRVWNIPLRLSALRAKAERRTERVEVVTPARPRETLLKKCACPRVIASTLVNLPQDHERIAHSFSIVRLASRL